MTVSSAQSTIPRSELDALLSENRELRAANRDLETVAYAIAHDLRAPLRTIGGFAQMLTGDLGGTLSEEVARDLSCIQSTVDQMQAMLRQWLSLVHKRHAVLEAQTIDLSALAESVAQELRIAHPERHVAIHVQNGLAANADEILLRELLQNLMGNAWKFTQQSAEPRIDIGAYRDRDRWVYFVRDNGIGFAEADCRRLFEPFVRVHQNTLYAGSGIGLTIAQRIVERHGGRIWAHAVPDMGATFKFTLGR
jgi:light-regulated signal transduction histidine kinase (bacteriophytochrome)